MPDVVGIDTRLERWQQRLHEHFEQLRNTRRKEGRPGLFALEHGLDFSAVGEISAALRDDILETAPSREVYLPWVIYATEIGYEYSGHEYWQTFEETTPGWRANGTREWLREGFRRFQADYDGIEPTGRWAKRFSIISWPITHAVLPKDLQRRLARMLHEVRHEFSSDNFRDPAAFGNLIAARGWQGTARFELLADEPELIGRIALSLLLKGKTEYQLPILRSTVDRIAADLEGVRQARDWLKDAQRSASRVQLTGLSPQRMRRPTGSLPITPLQAREAVEKLGVQPSLMLEPHEAGWQVWLELPNLAPLVERFPELRETLTQSRCTVAGSSGRPIARGNLLRGGHRVQLDRWPLPTETLLKFPDDPELLRAIFATECLLRPGPAWVFRIASDGTAYELRGRVLRPGQRYLVVTDEDSAKERFDRRETLACADVSAFAVDLPPLVPDEFASKLTELQLSVGRTVRVWPAGLPAAIWDGSGYAEWPVGEQPCIAASADHEVSSLSFRLASAPWTYAEAVPSSRGAPVFVQLPRLPIGAHLLEVRIESPSAEAELGHLEVVIRPRRPWTPGVTSDGAVSVLCDPADPSLEELWSGQAEINVLGPANTEVEFEVRLLKGESAFLNKRLPSLPLPVTKRAWRRHFLHYCRTDADWQNAYERADTATIDFTAGEVGHFQLTCEREFAPLRWKVQYGNKEYRLRLIDDRGKLDDASAYCYPLLRPDVCEPLRVDELAGGCVVPPGLYVAEAGEEQCAVIIPPGALHLQELQATPSVQSTDARELVHAIDLWTHARHTGAELKWRLGRKSLLALVRALVAKVAGEEWRLAEARYFKEGRLSELHDAVGHEDLARAVSDDIAGFVQKSPELRVLWFAEQLYQLRKLGPTRFSASDRPVFTAEFALRLASDPGTLRDWLCDQHKVDSGLKFLVNNQDVMRAARFAVLSVVNYLGSSDVPVGDGIYLGWEWR